MEKEAYAYGSGEGTRYGFNGMEKDDENFVGSLDFGGRNIYDSRVARFVSTDPDEAKYPFMSPYCFAANNPIYFIDIEGLGPKRVSCSDCPNDGAPYGKKGYHWRWSNKSDYEKYKNGPSGWRYKYNANHMSQRGAMGMYYYIMRVDEISIPSMPRPVLSPSNERLTKMEITNVGLPPLADDFKLPPDPPEAVKKGGGDLPPPGGGGDLPIATRPLPDGPAVGWFKATPGLPGYSKSADFEENMKKMADWLKENPELNITITAGGGGVTADGWNDNIGFSSTSYQQRFNRQRDDRLNELRKNGINVAARVTYVRGDVNTWAVSAAISN